MTLNRYSYCIGNPVNYADPSGHVYVMDEWGKEMYRPGRVEPESNFILDIYETYPKEVEKAMQMMNEGVTRERFMIAGFKDGFMEGTPGHISTRGEIETYIEQKVERADIWMTYYIGRCGASYIQEEIVKTITGLEILGFFYTGGTSFSYSGSEAMILQGTKGLTETQVIAGSTSLGSITLWDIYTTRMEVSAGMNIAFMKGIQNSGNEEKDSEDPDYKKENRVPLDKETVLNGKDYQKTGRKVKGAQVYKKDNKYYYRDTFHKGESAHLEVFDKNGHHLGEANPITGKLRVGTADPTKNLNIK